MSVTNAPVPARPLPPFLAAAEEDMPGRLADPATMEQRARYALAQPDTATGHQVAQYVLDTLAELTDPVDTAEVARSHPFPGNVLMHVAGMGDGSDDLDHDTGEVRTVVDDLDKAVVVTSLVERQPRPTPRDEDPEPEHRLVIDLDLPAKLIPSSTRGHHHLYLDRPLPWSKCLAMLDALAAGGLIEPGYAAAARQRGHTAVRVPWLRKSDPLPRLGPVPRACPECLRPDEDPLPWCECALGGLEQCAGPCRNRAHDPEQCTGTRAVLTPVTPRPAELDRLRARLSGA